MGLGIFYWIIFVILTGAAVWWSVVTSPPEKGPRVLYCLCAWVLFACLGWAQFGALIQGK
jgi:hypothetical protein